MNLQPVEVLKYLFMESIAKSGEKKLKNEHSQSVPVKHPNRLSVFSNKFPFTGELRYQCLALTQVLS